MPCSLIHLYNRREDRDVSYGLFLFVIYILYIIHAYDMILYIYIYHIKPDVQRVQRLRMEG